MEGREDEWSRRDDTAAFRVVASGTVGDAPDEALVWELREHAEHVLMWGTDASGQQSAFGTDRSGLSTKLVRGITQGALRTRAVTWWFAFGAIRPDVRDVVVVTEVDSEVKALVALHSDGAYYIAGPLEARVDGLIVTTDKETMTWPRSRRLPTTGTP